MARPQQRNENPRCDKKDFEQQGFSNKTQSGRYAKPYLPDLCPV
jgi:hypothetical protein